MDRAISPPVTKKRKWTPLQHEQGERPFGFRRQASRAPVSLTSLAGSGELTRLRVYSWNINGIGPFLQKPIASFFQSSKHDIGSAERGSLRGFLRKYDWPQVVCLQEVKMDPKDEKTKAAVARAVNELSSLSPDNDQEGEDVESKGFQYDVHFCLPRDRHNARGFGGKIYGVVTLIRSDFAETEVTRIREVSWDVEGRVLIAETKSKLAIFNVYAVNGTDRPYRDLLTGSVTGTRHDRKLAFHRLLLEECLSLEKGGLKLILAGDFNVAPSTIDGHPNLRTFPHQHVLNRADFNNKFFSDSEGLRGMDTWRHVHGQKRGYTYYPRGKPFGSSCDRVDLIIVSRAFVDGMEGDINYQLCDTGILESEEDRSLSDHVPLWVEVGYAAKTS